MFSGVHVALKSDLLYILNRTQRDVEGNVNKSSTNLNIIP